MNGGLGQGEVFSLLCALCWGVAVILFRRSGLSVPPLALNLFKNVFGTVLFLITMLVLQVPLLPPENTLADFWILFGSGMLGIGLSDTLFLWSLNRIGAGSIAVVECLYCPLVALCAFFYLGEDLGPVLLVAMGLMTAGILVASRGEKGGPGGCDAGGGKVCWRGTLAGILSMVGMAVGIVVAKPVLNHSNVWWAVVMRLSGALVFLGLLAFLPRIRGAYRRAFTPGPHWKPMIPASFAATYLGMTLWIAGMKYTDTSVASVLNQSSTIFIPLLAVLFLKESMPPRKILAVVLGFGGILVLALS
jgi:drug/metabolite transporter (DMT)-like permease